MGKIKLEGNDESPTWRRRKDYRPQELLAAARALIEEQGAAGTSMAQIARRAGVSEATVYKYFASKQDLLNRVLADWATPFVCRLTAELPRVTGLRAQLTLIAVRFLQSIEETPKLHRVFYQELRWRDYRGSELHRLNHRFAHSVVEIIQRASATGELRDGVNPTMIRDMLFGGLEHIAMRTSFIGRALDVEAQAADYVELMLSGMLKAVSVADAPAPAAIAPAEASDTAGGLLVERHGGVLLLTINRPDRRNAIDAATSRAIDREIDCAEADPAIGCVILTGAGDLAFCAGMDLKEAVVSGAGHGLIPGRGFAGLTQRQRTKPLIAAINGIAVAGGFEIALAADIIIAADHAEFGLSEVKRGMFAFAGGIQRLARQMPRAAAMSIILSGEPVPAARLHQLGIISEIVPANQLRVRTLAFAKAMLANSWQAIMNAKQLHDMAVDMPIPEALRVGMVLGQATLATADTREGIAAFNERRAAGFAADI